jgi:heme exporter protein A
MRAVERIDVRAVTCVLGGRTVLRRVSAVFERGTITFVEGPNGAGKSTLLGVIGTLMRPTSGSVDYSPSPESDEEVRAELGWLGHDARVYRELTSRENVALAARLAGIDPVEGWKRAVRRLGIDGLADQAVSTLSRGQRQRIALARAFVHEPSVLLLDEPATGLDTDGSERVERFLVEERDRGAIVVVVSHSPDAADRVRGRRLKLDRGKLVESQET